MAYRNVEDKRAANRKHYLANKETYRKRAREARKRHRVKLYNYVNEVKATSPCTDCHNYFDPICMDFDHCQGDKVAGISRLINLARPLEVIQAEIAKCELVCANCHRIRTRDR